MALDTYEVVRELRAVGFEEAQADALSRLLKRAQDVDLSTLATKADLRELGLQLDAKVEAAKAEMIKWMFGTIGLQTIVIIGALLTLVRGAARP